MPDREADVRRLLTAGRERGLTDDQIRALVRRYDERLTGPSTMQSGLERSRQAGRQVGETVSTALSNPVQLGKDIWEKFLDFGGAETAGGLAGGAVGGIPGAMGGASLVRLLRGTLQGESLGESVPSAVLEGGLEAIPLVGRAAKAGGRRLIRSALPIAKEAAEEVGGRAGAAAGADIIANRVADLPGGPRMKVVHRRLTDDLARLESKVKTGTAAADAAGTRIDPTGIWDEGQQILGREGSVGGRIGSPQMESGARSVLDRFVGQTSDTVPLSNDELTELIRQGVTDQTTKTVPRQLMTTEARDMLSRTPYVSGDPDVPGAGAMTRELRTVLSRLLKENVPEVGESFAKQSELIPVRDTLDAGLFASGHSPVAAPRAIVSGGRPSIFGMVPVSRKATFSAGRLSNELGKLLESRFGPGTARVIEGLLMPSHDTPQRRQLGAP